MIHTFPLWMSWVSLITWPPMLLFFFQGPCLSIRLRFVLMLFHQTISTHGLNFVYFSPIAKLCWWAFFYLEVVNSLAIFRLGGRALAWKNSRHCSTPPLVSPRSNVWEESAEISHRLRVTTQNRDSDASSEWNNNYFYARLSYVISLGNEQWRREMLVDFSG